MEFKVEAASTKSQRFLTAVMPSMIEQLGLTTSRKAVLVKVTNDNLDDMQGATLYIEFADCYLVLIKPAKKATMSALVEQATTLAHEMVHVRQLAKGIMRFEPNNVRIWRGRRYTKKTKYLDQPWELDAFARQEIIVRRAIEE